MKISDTEFRAYVAASLVGIVISKGAGDPTGCAKAAIKIAQTVRKELEAVKGEDDDYGKSRTGTEGNSA